MPAPAGRKHTILRLCHGLLKPYTIFFSLKNKCFLRKILYCLDLIAICAALVYKLEYPAPVVASANTLYQNVEPARWLLLYSL